MLSYVFLLRGALSANAHRHRISECPSVGAGMLRRRPSLLDDGSMFLQIDIGNLK